MQISLLGPFAAQEQGTSVVPSAAKPRQILALLALRANRVVTVPTIMEEIWGDSPPRSAPTTLQTYILQLRRLLGRAMKGDGPATDAKEILTTQYGGYLLDVQPTEVDTMAFDRLRERGEAAFEAGDHQAASALLGQALALWRGPALVDVKAGLVLEIEVLRLEEARLSTLENRISADLSLGRHRQVLSELAVLAAQNGLHEELHAQFMLAQYRSGRIWQALQTYEKLRNTLVSELGIEPTARVRRLFQAILSADPSLDLPPAPAGPTARPSLRSVV